MSSVKHTWKYINHLRSPEWRNLRRRLLNERLNICERCGYVFAESQLELHHLTYERLGSELDSDVQLLCKPCHGKADAERQLESSRRAANALYSARLIGYAAKKYGEDVVITDDIEEEFDRWVERKELREEYD